MSNTFCPMPWNSVNIRNNGDMRICCNTNSYTKNRGIIRKADGTPYNIGKDEINEARNAELLKEVRLKMLNGEWHSECGSFGIIARRFYKQHSNDSETGRQRKIGIIWGRSG
jgi:hypothetical protein